MAEATPLETLSPKELGKRLREVRRRKGLSLSEVARGAGLTRRELNAYEKGRAPIPDSDLFVLAGSCGVDVAELRVATTTAELNASREVGNALVPASQPQQLPSTIGDAVAQLRRGQEVPVPSVPQPERRRRPRALGRRKEVDADQPVATDSPDSLGSFEATDWLGDASIPSPSNSAPRGPAQPVDVFEELARLPEPEPLTTDAMADHDIFGPLSDLTPPSVTDASPDAPVLDEWPAFESEFNEAPPDEPDGEPVLVEMPPDEIADLTNASDAPPIDVEMRGESFNSPWDALRGGEAVATPDQSEAGFEGDDWVYESPAQSPAEAWAEALAETTDVDDSWQSVPMATSATAWFDEVSSVPTPDTHPSAFDLHVDDEWIDTLDTVDTFDVVETDGASADPSEASVSQIFDPRFSETPEAAPGSWAHEPDPDATSTGFYIDWGDAEDDATAASGVVTSAWDLPIFAPADDQFETSAEVAEPDDVGEADAGAEAETAAATLAAPWEPSTGVPDDAESLEAYGEPEAFGGLEIIERVDAESAEPYETLESVETLEPFESVEIVEPFERLDSVETSEAFESSDPAEPFGPAAPLETDPDSGDDELPVISWRPEIDAAVAPPIEASEPADAEPQDAEPDLRETFVVAGPDWVLGNAVPLVEVRNTGSLVMRRVDERWALADLVASANFAIEVQFEFRSGPGFGVIFCADLDDQGRMSGYSFDVDPVYEGGGYLVREWRADRELWNPVAHVPAPHLTGMNGTFDVRVTVDDDSLVAMVNGETVLTVDSLQQASIDRGRAGTTGDRVGVQAWSSTDLVIDELRLANH